MSDSERESTSPLSQFSVEDDEIVWTHSSCSDADFIVLHHPLLDAHSLPSTLSDFTHSDLSLALDRLSLCDHDSVSYSPSASAESDSDRAPSGNPVRTDKLARGNYRKTKPRTRSSSDTCHSEVTTPTASYDDASAFITRFISSPAKGNSAELSFLRALVVELGMLKAEAHVNVNEYLATRHKGQSALREILKPSKSALRRDIRKGNRASLRSVKQQGLRVLLVTCFT